MPIIDAGDLSVAYRDHGDPAAPAALLLHGWPDDASTWDGVVPALVAAGLRVVVPSLRGFGETRVRQGAARTGNSARLATDAIALMDALGIERFHVAGHDWGANAGEALAVGWPDRVRTLAMLGTPARLGGMPTPPFEQAQRQWYHWFMATDRAAAAIRDDRRGFAHLHWVNWGPNRWFDEATFARVAAAWDNPDWLDVTLHSYRARWDVAAPDPATQWLEDRIKATEQLSLPAIYLAGGVDGVNPPETAEAMPAKFAGPFELAVLHGVGHFLPREAPDEVARRLVALFTGQSR